MNIMKKEEKDMSKEKVVILGAGYAGLRSLKEIQKKNLNVDITLVNKNDYHYEATYLHEVASGAQPPKKICYPVKDVVDPKQTTFIQDTVEVINKDQKTVTLANNGDIDYDYLVVALGFESETFGIKGAAENGLEMVDIPSALAIDRHINEQFAKYNETKDESYLSIVVCGAGFTSIEFLGEITDQLPRLVSQYQVPADKIQLTCIEAMPTLLPMFPEKLTKYGIDKLVERGVNFKIGAPIQEVTKDEVVYKAGDKNESVKAKTIVWTTGVRGSSVIGRSGFDERRGRVVVEKDLTIAGYPEIFMIGDVSAVMDEETGRPIPGTAQLALKQGDTVAENLEAKLNGKETKAFTFKSLGTVASIGNKEAIGEVMGSYLKGYPASAMKKVIADRSLLKTGGVKAVVSKGRFDLYH